MPTVRSRLCTAYSVKGLEVPPVAISSFEHHNGLVASVLREDTLEPVMDLTLLFPFFQPLGEDWWLYGDL
ncbi:hypothetical protein TNCV_682671 [Trichonephila clavipes]|nr:hypothetical protein TNCV_682671 [Trichonephila clavipes]